MRSVACFWLVSSLAIVNLHSLPSTVIILVCLLVIVVFALKIPRSRKAIAGVLLGVLSTTGSFVHVASHQLLASQVSTDLTITVRIASVPEQHKARLSFIADVLSCHSCQKPLDVERIRLSWYGRFPNLRAGEVWQLETRLKPPSSLRNTGGFDAVAWALVKGLHARGYVRDSDSARRLSASANSLSLARQTAAQSLATLLDNSEQLGLLQALTVGVKTHISKEQWDLLRDTGTAHLLAISGLHVGLVAGWVLLLGKRVGNYAAHALSAMSSGRLTIDPRPWVLVSALLTAFAYAALAGFELPTQRAVLMLSVWVIASIRFRFLPPMTALSVALIIVLSMNALSLLSAGFWLSFGTVAALFYLHSAHKAPSPDATLGRWQAFAAKSGAAGRTHLLLGIVLLPVSAWYFQTGSLIAPLANLIAVPWVALVSVPLSLLGLISSFFSETVAALLLYIADKSLQGLLVILQWLNQSDVSSVVLTLPSAAAFVFVILGLVLLFSPRGIGLRWLATPLFLPALLFNSSVPETDGFEVHVLDVGQGLAALVFVGEHTALFDTGGKVSPGLSMFEAAVVPFLHASGRRQLDTLIVSHGDEDHAFGVADVLRRYPDIHVFSSQQIAGAGAHPVTLCEAGTTWDVEGVHFAFIHPSDTDAGSDNDRSCVLMVYRGDSRVLLTGDIEAAAEKRLVARLSDSPDFPVTLMTAPHHGSNTSSSKEFVEKLRPEYVVFPAASSNRYGFPHSDVQLRYKLVGSKSFTTGHEGAISFEFGEQGLVSPPTRWWDSRRRFWHGIVNPDCWQRFASQSIVLRLLGLSQKGQTLCGK